MSGFQKQKRSKNIDCLLKPLLWLFGCIRFPYCMLHLEYGVFVRCFICSKWIMELLQFLDLVLSDHNSFCSMVWDDLVELGCFMWETASIYPAFLTERLCEVVLTVMQSNTKSVQYSCTVFLLAASIVRFILVTVIPFNFSQFSFSVGFRLALVSTEEISLIFLAW